MAKYVYPAIFTPEENGTYSIVFPDLEGCYTCGDDLEDGIEVLLSLREYYDKLAALLPFTFNAQTAFVWRSQSE